MGVLVPPCLMMVVLASLTDLSVAALFMAGLPARRGHGPAADAGLIYVQARRENLPRRATAVRRGRCCARCARGTLPLIAPVIILGGILGGIVAPHRRPRCSRVLHALVLGKLVDLPQRSARATSCRSLINTASLTGMVMLLLVGTASGALAGSSRAPGASAADRGRCSSGSRPD